VVSHNVLDSKVTVDSVTVKAELVRVDPGGADELDIIC